MSSQSPFYVGQKVVCIESGRTTYHLITVKRGKTYTISNPNFEYCTNTTGQLHVQVLETGNAIWLGKRFVPADEMYTDMTKEIAESLKETAERPDKVLIPETVNN